MTRGRCGSLLLHRVKLSFTTPRRFNRRYGGIHMRSRHLKMEPAPPGGPTRAELRKRQRARERAAGLAARSLPIGVRKMIDILRHDPDPRNRIAAFNTLADRGGLPKFQ